MTAVVDPGGLRAAGTSPSAIEHHYDLSDQVFAAWLGPEMVYSCALWAEGEGPGALAAAQARKLDDLAAEVGAAGGRVLDIGCGWGALLDRFVRVHGAAGGVGLTLSPSQRAFARARGVPGADYRLESWVDHEPAAPYDAVTCVEMTEHLASDALGVDEKVAVYRAFFERNASWLRDGGRMGLQLICLDNVGHAGSRAGRGPLSELIRTDIFPESMPAALSELLIGWETWFRIVRFRDDSDHYRRTFRAWNRAWRAQPAERLAVVPAELRRTLERYFAAGEACFRLREHALYRVTLERRAAPKRWVVPPAPAPLADLEADRRADPADNASAEAVRSHYDVSNAFYRSWLGPTMQYTSGMAGEGTWDLDDANARKADHFLAAVLPDGGRLLDVGCGWGWVAARALAEHGATSAVGLTLSDAQAAWTQAHHVAGREVRVEGWAEHEPDAPYDGIVSFGAFEHFARDGTTSAQRVAVYRRFFARCFSWLVPGGRLGLETIAHDDAPDTVSPLGRGPLGDVVLGLYPESLCPHVSEVLLGFEPYFEVAELRCDAADFARTCRSWLLALRAHRDVAVGEVGPEAYRQWQRYLVASEVQFRDGTITNLRLVLRRRPAVRW